MVVNCTSTTKDFKLVQELGLVMEYLPTELPKYITIYINRGYKGACIRFVVKPRLLIRSRLLSKEIKLKPSSLPRFKPASQYWWQLASLKY